MKAGYAAAPALIGALLAGTCGGSGGTSATRTVTHAVHRRAATPAGLRLGQAYEVTAGGSFLSVAATKVIDPLTDSGAALLSGMRAARAAG